MDQVHSALYGPAHHSRCTRCRHVCNTHLHPKVSTPFCTCIFICPCHTVANSDAADKELYRIVGSCCQPGKICRCPCAPCDQIVYNVFAAGGGGEPIGAIKKVWAGCGKELLTDADTFTLQFPPTLPPQHKGIFLGALILMDFLYFEDKDKNK
jgi:hypothetical protein